MDINSVSSTTHIFGNDLLFRKIAGYLGMPDLKILRQTSKFMLDKVNNIPGFIKNLEITICLESVREGFIAQTTLPWRKAILALENYDDPTWEETKKCLRQVQHLEIRVQATKTSLRPEDVHEICYLILELEDLKSLSVPGEFLTWENVICIIGRKLSTLEGLHLFERSMGCGDYYNRSVSEIKISQNWESELCNLDWKLKSFHVEKAFLPTSTTASILKSSASTLETIQLISKYYNDFPLISFGDLIFPYLKSIKYSITSSADEENFAAFLRNQPSLESIQVGIIPRYARHVQQHYIGPQIMDAIREKSSQLKTLDFYLDNANWRKSFPLRWDWEFLQLCGKLKEFRLPQGHLHLGPDLPHLPTNVESLHLFNLRAGGMDPASMIQGFPHLTQLKFASPTALTDDILQAICRNNTALRVFHFWVGFHGFHVTDFGLTGERENENSGTSLRSLKGLRDLEILGRGRVTTEGLSKAIRFQELRMLDLSGERNNRKLVPEDVVLEIAKNNPSLELLNCNVDLRSEDSVFLLFRKIRAVNQRMTKLGTQMCNSVQKTTCKPSYGISSMACDSEFRFAKNGRGELVFTVFGSTKKETPRTYENQDHV